MSAPSFIASYSSTYSNNVNPKTTSVTTLAGDVVVITAAAENGYETFNVPTGNGITFTQQQLYENGDGYASVGIWTGIDTTGGTSWELSLSLTTGISVIFGLTCYVFRDSSGVGASSVYETSPGAPSLGLTTTQDNSAIVVVNADWSAIDGASRIWRTVNSITPTSGNGLERQYFRNTVNYAAYSAYYDDAGAAGSKTVGLSAPSGQQYSIAAVEILGTAAGAIESLPLMWIQGVNS